MLALTYSESGTGTNFMNTTITVDFQEKFALFNGKKKGMVTSERPIA